MIEIKKNGESRMVKERYLQNFLDRGWTTAKAKKTKPAAKIEAAAEVKPVEADDNWTTNEQDFVYNNNKGED